MPGSHDLERRTRARGRWRPVGLLGALAVLPVLAWSAAALADPPPPGAPAPPAQPAQPAQPDDDRGGRAAGMLTKPKDEPAAPPQPAPPNVTLPVVKKDPGARYPRRALADKVREPVTVVLVLSLDAQGGVTSATVESPQGHGFDEAAVEAAQGLAFEPARRDGKAIAAKIRHKYVFTPPPARFGGKALGGERDTPLAGARVTVTGADGQARTALTAPDGSWSFDVPPGRYKIVVTAEGYDPRDTEEPAEAGEEVGVTLRLARPGATTPGAAAAASSDGPVVDIQVRGERPPREITRRTLEQRELLRIPGTNGDALRAIQNLPGVARPPALAGLLIVRGSGPQDTNVFIDGTLVPIVYHFGGLSSVVPTESLERLDFYPGNFSTQYGRVMGGIVDVGLRDPRARDGKVHGLAQVDLIDARVLAEGPIGKGWSFMVGGRRSYVDAWLGPVLAAAGSGVSTAPRYYDYQAIIAKELSSKSSFRLAFFGSDDKLEILVKGVNAQEPGLTGGLAAHTGFWRAQARYKNRFSEDTELRMTSAVGQDFIDFSLGDIFFKLTTFPVMTRLELGQKLAPGVVTNFGVDLLYVPYDVFARFPPPARPGEPPGGPFLSRPALTSQDTDAVFRPGFYDEFELTPWRGGRIVPGVRVDYSRDIKKWDVSPRMVARQDLTRGFPRTTVKGGVGVFRQPPQPQETNPVFGQLGLSSNRANHYTAGFEQEITRHVEIGMEGFYKQLDNLVVLRRGNQGLGRVYGVETLLRYKPDARFFGWLAYTLSRSDRKDLSEEDWRPFQFDQTHILTVLGSYRLGRGWEVGARFRLVSGSLTTPNRYGFFDENAGAYLPDQDFPLFGERLPMFHQLDIRVDKVWKTKDFTFSLYMDLQNAYNRSNVEGVQYNFNYSQRQFATGLPFLPSFGIRGEL